MEIRGPSTLTPLPHDSARDKYGLAIGSSTSNPAFGRRMEHGLPSTETVGDRAGTDGTDTEYAVWWYHAANPLQNLGTTHPRRAFGANLGHAHAMPSWP